MSISGLDMKAVARRLERNRSLQEMYFGDSTWKAVYFRSEGKAGVTTIFQLSAMNKDRKGVCILKEGTLQASGPNLGGRGREKNRILHRLCIQWYLVGSWVCGLELRRVLWLVIKIWEPYVCRT